MQVSQDTFRLIEPFFEVEALGGVELKGKSEPVPAYRVIACQGRAMAIATAASAPH